MKRELVDEFRARLRGRIWSPAPAQLHRDFGRAIEREPGVVVQATCERDVVETLAVCRERRLPLVVRGAGHSCGGQALLEGGVVLWNCADHADEADAQLDGDVVDVSGRTTWNALEAFLGARGRSAMVLPDHLDLTVGGTLSVGGYGVRSVMWGSQADRVHSLRVITPDGRARWLPADDRLARQVLAGVGRLGVIERVRLPTLLQRPAVRWRTQTFDGLGSLARWLRWVEEVEHPHLWIDAWWNDGVALAEWGVEAADVDAASAMKIPGPAYERETRAWHLPLVLHDKRWRWVRRHRGHRRLWIDVMLPHAPFVELCEHVQRVQLDGGVAPTAAYILVSRRPPDRLAPVWSASPWPVSYGMGLYFMVPPDEDSTRVEQAIDGFLARADELGARPYRYGVRTTAPVDEQIERLRAEVGAGSWFAPRPPELGGPGDVGR